MNGPSSWSRQNFRLLNQEHKIRLVLTFVLVLLVVGGGKAITDPWQAWAGVFLMLGALIVSRFVVKQPNRPLKTQFQLSALVVGLLNIVAVTLLLQGTGGMHSGFFSLYLVTIVFASVIFRGIELALLTALSGCFFILVSLPLDTAFDWWQVGAHLTGLVIVAWYAYSLSDVLHREKEANDQLLRHLSEGIIVLDSRERLTLVNPTLLSMVNGLQEDQLIGRSRGEVVGLNNLLGWLLADVGEAAGGDDYYSRVGCFPEADLPLVECNTIECRSEEGIDGWVIVCRDLRDQPLDGKSTPRPLYDKLAPLSNLRALSQALYGMAEYLDDSRRWQIVSAIEEHTQALQQLLAEMLHSTADNATGLQLSFVELPVLLSNTRRLLEIQAGGIEVPVEIEVQEGLPEISADRNQLGHVLLQVAKTLMTRAQPGDRLLVSGNTAPGGVSLAAELLGEGERAAAMQPVGTVDQCLPAEIVAELRELEIITVIAQHQGQWECASVPEAGRRVAFQLPVQGPVVLMAGAGQAVEEADPERAVSTLPPSEPLSSVLAAEVFNQLKNAISAIRGHAELALRLDDPARCERTLQLTMGLSNQASDLVEALQPSRVELDFITAHQAAEGDLPEDREQALASVAALPDGARYLLVVDDDQAVRELLIDALSGVGYQVQAAEDGRQAVEYLKVSPPLMAFVDISMPRVTGIEVLREARQHAPGMPVVLMTGYAYAVAVEAIGDEKPYALLSKPFSISELISLARSVAGDP